jgi:hypothetical protein
VCGESWTVEKGNKKGEILNYNKGKPIKITADFSIETLKERTRLNEVFRALQENNFKPTMLYPAKLF